MGKGAYITVFNNTPFALSFGTSDKNGGWKNDTVNRINSDLIDSHKHSDEFYIEANESFFGFPEIKFWVKQKNILNGHFANVHIVKQLDKYVQVDHYINGLKASAIFKEGEQCKIDIYITIPSKRDEWSNSQWLGSLPDNFTLNNICIPGSHDAGMYRTKVAVGDGLALTQSLSIYGQLRAGSRYFDLRPHYINGKGFYLYHGMADGPKLEEVLEDFKNFIQKHSTETAILEFSHFANCNEKLNDFVDLILSIIPASNLLNVSAPLDWSKLTLSDVRGKLIITTEHEEMYKNSIIGRGKKGLYYSNKEHNKNVIYDDYSNKQKYDDMIKDQAQKFYNFNEYTDSGSPKLFMFNWTLTPLSPDAYKMGSAVSSSVKSMGIGGYIAGLIIGKEIDDAAASAAALINSESVIVYAKEINPKLKDALKEHPNLFKRNTHKRMVNIINLDFIELADAVKVCQEVIQQCN